MSDKLPVSVIITTYDPGNGSRFNLLYQTIQSLLDNLKYPNLEWIITDDSEPVVHQELLVNLQEKFKETSFKVFNTNRRGVGFGKNQALREAFKTSHLVILGEDDWVMRNPFDLLPHIQLMLDNPDIGIIRLGFLGGFLKATYTDYGYPLTYWSIDPSSGFYAYSGQISIRSKVWYDNVGYHAEGIQAGQEEEDMCRRTGELAAVKTLPKILWPAQYGSTLNSLGGIFVNIGLGSSVNSVVPAGA